MKNNQTNNDKIKSLPKDGISVFYGENWVEIIRAIELDKNSSLKTYTHKEIQEIGKVTKSQLNHLVQTKTITPYQEERGRGGRSTYDYTNLLEVLFCREMRKFSIGIHIIKNHLDWLRNKVWEFNFSASFRLPPEFPEELLQYLSPDNSSVKSTEELNKSIMYGDFPRKIKRTHTIWDFLRIYPYGCGTFYFLFGNIFKDRTKTEKDYTKPFFYKADLFEELDIHDGVNNIISSILINLSELKREVDQFKL